jgi:hypothetical protein
MSIRLPTSIHQRVRELARRENISINQLIASAVAEKLAALMAEEIIGERARRGSRAKFDRALALVPDVKPDPGDAKPRRRRRSRR